MARGRNGARKPGEMNPVVEQKLNGGDEFLILADALNLARIVRPTTPNALITTRIFSENFTGFTGAGFNSTPAAGQLDSDIWRVGGLSDNSNPLYGFTGASGSDFGRGSIGSNDPTTAGVYSVTSNAALVVQPTGTEMEANGFIECRITNSSGLTANGLIIAFDWTYRNSGDRASSLAFSYSTDGTNFITIPAAAFTTPTTLTSPLTGTFLTQAESITLSGLSIANGAFIYLRWTHLSSTGSGNRDEIGIDNLVVDTTTLQPGSLAVNDVTHSEGDTGTTTYTFTVTRSGGSDGAVSVNWAVSFPGGGSGADAADLTGTTSGTLNFANGETSKTITVTVSGDTAFEPNESFNIVLSNATGGASISDATGVGTITNDDPEPQPGTLSINDISELEEHGGATSFFFIVTRSGGSDGAVSATWTLTLSGDADSADFDIYPQSGTVSFAEGETLHAIEIFVRGDMDVEPDELFSVVLSAPTGGATLADATGEGTILNDDTPANQPPEGQDNSIVGAEDLPYVFTLADFPFTDGENDDLTHVRITTLPEVGTLFLNGVPVSAGADVAVQDIIDGDLVYLPAANGNGLAYADFTFQVVAAGDAIDPTPNLLTINITPQNDDPFITGLNGDVVTGRPNAGIQLLDAGGDALVEDVDSANFDGGYLSVTIMTGAQSGDSINFVQTYPAVYAVDNALYVNDVEIGTYGLLGFGMVFNFNAAATPEAVQTLIRAIGINDTVGNPGLRYIQWDLRDGDGGSYLAFTAITLDDTNLPPAVDLNGADQAGTGFAVTWLIGDTAGVPIGDTDLAITDDGDVIESVSITLSDYVAGDELFADSLPFSFYASWDQDSHTVVLQSVFGPVPASWFTDALRYIRFRHNGPDPTAGGTDTERTISVTAYDGVQNGPAAVATITLEEPVPVPGTLYIGNVTMAEGNSGFTEFSFLVQRAEGTLGTVTADWALNFAGAADAADFDGPTSGVVTFLDGETSQTIVIRVVGDLDIEADETFTVTLSNPTGGGGIGGSGTAYGVIRNDDFPYSDPPVVTGLEGDTVTWNGTAVLLDGGAALTLGDPDSATFNNSTLTVSSSDALDSLFAVGVPGVLGVGSGYVDDGKDIFATFTGGSGGAPLVFSFNSFATPALVQLLMRHLAFDSGAATPGTHQITYAFDGAAGEATWHSNVEIDTSAGALSVADAMDYEATDYNNIIVFTVTRTGGAYGAVEATWTLNLTGSATAEDFTGALTGTVSFANGQTTASFYVEVVGEPTLEPDETFEIVLSDPTNGATIADGTATGTILNDDTPPNTPPVVDLNGAGAGLDFAATFVEGGTGVAIGAPDLTLTDDGNHVTIVTLAITDGVAGDELFLAGSVAPNFDISWSAIDWTLTIKDQSGTAVPADFAAVLALVQFRHTGPDANAGGTDTARTIEVIATDGALYSTPVYSTITVEDAPNLPPVVDLNGGDAGIDFAATYNESSPGVAIAGAGAFVAAGDADPILSLRVVIDDGVAGDELFISGTLPDGMNVSWNPSTFLLELSGSGLTAADYTAALGTIFFRSSLDDPNAGGADPTRSITVMATDGVYGPAATSTILVADLPVTVDLDSGESGFNYAGAFTEQGAAVAIGSGINVTTLSGSVSNMIVQLTDGTAGDQLTYDPGTVPGGFIVNASATQIAIFGIGSAEQYEAMLASIRYVNNGDNPTLNGNTDRVIAVTVSDHISGATSPTAYATIAVTAVNDLPTIGGNAAGDIYEDATFSTSGQLTISDPDSNEARFQALGTSGNYGSFNISQSGFWTYNANANQFMRGGQTYTDTFSVWSFDNSSYVDVVITSHGNNDAPNIFISGGNTVGYVFEDQVGGDTDGHVVPILDPDENESGWVSGDFTTAYGTFHIETNGTWTYTLNNAAPALLALDTGEHVTDTHVMTSLGGDQITLQVQVNGNTDPLSAAPVLNAPIADQTISEDSPVNFQIPAGTFTDSDSALVYTATLDGGDPLPSWLTFDAATRTFSGTPPLDYNGTLSITVTVSDYQSTASDTFDLIVNPVNDAPVLTGLLGDIVTHEAGAAAVLLDLGADGLGTDSDPELNGVAGGTLTIAVTGGGVAAEDVLSIVAGNGVTLSGSNILFDGGIHASFSGGTGGNPLVITLNGDMNETLLARLLHQIGYSNSNAINPSTAQRTITWTLNDGDGTANGGVATATATSFVNVTDANDAPLITNIQGDAVTYVEGATNVVLDLGANAALTDLDSMNFDGGSLTVGIYSGYAGSEGLTPFTGVVTPGSGVNVNGINIGTFASGGSFFVINFNANATAARVEILLRSIAYRNFQGDNPTAGERLISWTLVDGDGTANGGTDTVVVTSSVTVVAVNDAPSGTDKTVTFLEDSLYTLGTADFGFADVENHGFAGVTITTLPTNGNLLLGGSTISAGTFVTAAQISGGQLVFIPPFNGSGPAYASLTFQVRDNGGTANGGVDTDQSPNTLTFNVTNINDAPTLSGIQGDAAIYIEGSAPVVLDLGANAVLADIDSPNFGGGFLEVGIYGNYNPGQDSLTPFTGAVTSNLGVNVNGINIGQYFSGGSFFRIEFNANATLELVQILLRSIAYRNFNIDNPVAGRRDISWTLDDGDGTANGGQNSIVVTSSVTVGVLNDAPSGIDATIAVLEDGSHTFTAADFAYTDPENNGFAGVIITTLPAAGTLTLNGNSFVAGTLVTAAEIAAGQLVFTPAPEVSGAAYASFTFQVRDNAGTADGGQDTDQSPNTITVNVTPVNDAPTWTNLDGDAVTYTEGGAAIFMDSGQDVLVADIDSMDFDGGVLRVDIVNGYTAGQDSITVGNTARVELSGGVRVDGVLIGSFSHGGSFFIVTFNANATADAVQEVIRAITYRNTNVENPFAGTRTIGWFLSDGDGTANGGAESVGAVTTVTVLAVNDAPSGADKTVSIREDGSHIFSAADFGYSDPENNAFSGVVVTTVPGAGTLTLNGVAVIAGDFVGAAQLLAGELVFAPAPGTTGAAYASFTFQVRDNGGTANGGQDTDQSPNTINFDVLEINDAPAGTDGDLYMLEDGTHVFTAADFGFTDPANNPAHGLLAVRITTLPAAGSLLLNSVAVTAGQFVAAAAIAAGQLTFQPAPNANGFNYASFTFQVQDDGGTASGGVDLDQSPNTISVHVTPVADAPSGTDSSVTMPEDGTYILTVADFGFTDVLDGNSLFGVIITTVPATGLLFYNGGQPIGANTFISVTDLASGAIRYTPAANASGADYASLTFQVVDNGIPGNGGEVIDQTPNTLTFHVTPVGDAPVAEDVIAQTPEDFPFGSVYLMVADADDPDGSGTPPTFTFDTLPAHVALATQFGDPLQTGVAYAADYYDGSAGRWIFIVNYVPDANWSGQVSFDYVVTDADDDMSAPATATIEIEAVADAPTVDPGVGGPPEATGGAINLTGTGGFEDSPTIVALPGGRSLVVWQAGFGSVRARYLDADGNPDGAAFDVTAPGGQAEILPVIAAQPNGNFAIAWFEDGATLATDTFRIAFYAAGATVPYTVSTYPPSTAFYEADPVLTAGPDDSYMLTWAREAGGSAEIVGQLFGDDGQPLGDPQTIMTSAAMGPNSGQFFDPPDHRVALVGDHFVLIAQNTDGQLIASFFDRNGLQEMLPIVGAGGGATVTALDGGNFVITWSDGSDLKAEIFTSAGTSLGEVTLASPAGGSFFTPEVAALPSGGFVVAWVGNTGTAGSYDIFAQTFSATGAPLSAAPLQVTQTGLNGMGMPINEIQPTISVSSEGLVTIGWLQPFATGNPQDVFLQSFTLRPDSIHANAGSQVILPATFGLTDTDGSEVLSQVRIAGMPEGFSFPLGYRENGDPEGAWIFDRSTPEMAALLDDLATGATNILNMHVAADYEGDPVLQITATSQETSNGSTATSTVATLPLHINLLPVAVDDLLTANEDESKIFTAADLLGNDIDAPTATLTIVSVTPVSGGTATLLPDGTVLFTASPDYHGPAVFTYVIDDGRGGTDTGEATVNVLPVNDAPSGTDATRIIAEDGVFTFAPGDFGFSDAVEGDAFLEVIITTLPGAGTLMLNGNPVTAGQAIAAGSIPLLVYIPPANASGPGLGSFTFQVRDNGGTATGGQDTDQSPNTFTIDVAPVNDAPAGADATLTFVEDAAYTFAVADFGFADPDDSPANGLLAVRITTLPGAGTLLLNNVAVTAGQSIAVSAIAAGQLTFQPAPDGFGDGYASFTFQVRDDGGTASGGVDLDQSPNTITFNITPENDVPILTGGNTVSYVENGAPVIIDPAVVVSDVDNMTFASATVTISGNWQPADVLALQGSLPTMGSMSYSIGTGVLTIIAAPGGWTAAQWETVLRSVTFSSASNDPGPVRAIDFALSDGQGVSANLTSQINITPVNDAPGLASLEGDTVTFTEGDGEVRLDLGEDALLTDIDSLNFDGGTMTVAIDGVLPDEYLSFQVGGQISAAGGFVYVGPQFNNQFFGTFTGGSGAPLVFTFNSLATLDLVQELIHRLTYYNGNQDNPTGGPRQVTITLTDGDGTANGGADTVIAGMTVNVVPVNDLPLLSGGGTPTYVENGTPVVVNADLTIADVDDTQLVSALVAIAGNWAGAQDVLAFVNDDNALYGNIAASFSPGSGGLTLTSAGGTATLAQWQAALRAVTYSNTSDNPSTAVRGIDFTVNDGDGNSNTLSTTLTVTAVNDAPTVANLNGDAAVWTEGGGNIFLDVGRDASVADIDSASFAGATLRVEISGINPDEDVPYIAFGGDVTNSGIFIFVDGEYVGDLGYDGGNLAISLNANATPAAVQALIRATAYANLAGDNPTGGTRTVTWILTDGDGVANGGTDTLVATSTLNLVPVNDAPSGADSGATILEDTAAYVFSAADFPYSDPEGTLFGGVTFTSLPTGGTLYYDVDGPGGTAPFAFSPGSSFAASELAAGKVYYVPNADANGSHSFSFVVFEAGGGLDDPTPNIFTFTITPVNDAPVLSNDADLFLPTLDEDAGPPSGLAGVSVATLVDFFTPSGQRDNVTDVDGGALLGIAITGIAAGGTLYYSTNGGANWTLAASVSDASALLLTADSGTRIYFRPPANFHGAYEEAITFRAWDRSSGTAGSFADTTINGGTTAFSSATERVELTVNSVNDAPSGADKTIMLAEDGTYVLTTADFGFTDADGNQLFEVVLSTTPTGGTLYLDTDGPGGAAPTTLGATSTVSAADIAAGHVYFVPTANGNGTAYGNFQFQVRDDGGTANGGGDIDITPNTITFDVTAVNDAPTVTIQPPGYAAVEQVGASLKGTIAIGDVDAGSSVLTVTLSVGYGLINVSVGTSGASIVSGNGTGSVVVSGTLAQLNALLNGDATSTVTFTANTDAPPATTTFTVIANDGGATGPGGPLAGSANATIAIAPVNDAPAGADRTVSVSEDDPYVFSLADFGFTDAAEGHGFEGIHLTSLPSAGHLYVDPDGPGGASPLQLAAPGFILASDIVAGHFYFLPAPDQSGNNYASFGFRVQDNGGTANGGVNIDPTPNTITINVTPDNLPPVVDLNGGGAGIDYSTSFTEDGPAVAIGSGIIVSDPDSGAGDLIESATITLIDRVAGDALVLGTPLGGFSIATVSSAGAITIQITGTGTAAQYQQMIQSITYATTSQDPTVGGTDPSRTITVLVGDGAANSAVATATINITPIDDAPVAQPDAFTITESGTITNGNLFANNGSGADSDPDGPPLSISAVNGSGANVGSQITLASGALLTVNANGTFSYNPNGAFLPTPAAGSGAANTPAHDSFTYTLAAGNMVTVTITLTGLDTDDVLRGTVGADILSGGLGNDTYYVENTGDQVLETVGQGNDRIVTSVSYALAAGTSVETLEAGAGTATLALVGNELANTLIGNAGANILSGGGGADAMAGHGGNDTYYVDNAGDSVTEGAGEGFDALYTSVSYALAAGSEVEWFSTASNAATDPINLVGNSLAQYIIGNAGANVINGGGGGDILRGLGGNDTYIIADAAAVTQEQAGGGFDAIYTTGSYALANGTEIEWLSAADNAGTAALNLTGNEIANYLVGNAGLNVLDGGAGADFLYGLGGNDTYVVDNAGDQLFESVGNGFDAAYASVSYALAAGQEIEWLSTANNNATDAINLTGNEFANYLVGNAGANLLDGKGGEDILIGNAGADTFAFTTAPGAGNVDLIVGFEQGVDKIALDDAVFSAIGGLGALNPNAFVTGSAAADASDRIIYNSLTGQLFYDADGNGAGAAVQFATLSPGLTLTAGDFTVI